MTVKLLPDVFRCILLYIYIYIDAYFLKTPLLEFCIIVDYCGFYYIPKARLIIWNDLIHSMCDPSADLWCHFLI